MPEFSVKCKELFDNIVVHFWQTKIQFFNLPKYRFLLENTDFEGFEYSLGFCRLASMNLTMIGSNYRDLKQCWSKLKIGCLHLINMAVILNKIDLTYLKLF